MSKYFVAVFAVIILLTAFTPTPAKADSIDTFVWVPCSNSTGYNCGPQTSGPVEYTWQAPASPTPTYSCPSCSFFDITADVTANGTDFGPTTIEFGTRGEGGFNIPALNIFTGGAVFWNGPAPSPDLSPTFIPGTYLLGNNFLYPQIGTLTVTSATGVPEPSALLQTGAGLLLALAVIAFWRRESASTICS
jgi:hypothetical protein